MAGRALAITGLGAGILWFGHVYAPVPEAQATVYEVLGSTLTGVPPFMQFSVREDQVQTAVLNGGRVHYTLSSTDRSIRDVLDFYESMYAVPASKDRIDVGRLKSMMKDVQRARPKFAEVLPQIDQMLARNAFRVDRGTFGMYGAVRAGDEGEPDHAQRALERVSRFVESGRIGDLGDVKVVYAMRPTGASKTTLFTFWPDPDYRLDSLSVPEEGDVPGSDIPGLPRPERSRRLLSFGQDMTGIDYRIASYEEPEGRSAAATSWSARLASAGWREDTLARRRSEGSGSGTALFFTRPGREAFVRIDEDPRSGQARSTVFVSGRPTR